jgi:hypothetical protein
MGEAAPGGKNVREGPAFSGESYASSFRLMRCIPIDPSAVDVIDVSTLGNLARVCCEPIPV